MVSAYILNVKRLDALSTLFYWLLARVLAPPETSIAAELKGKTSATAFQTEPVCSRQLT
jgi:hypothetical protein